MRCAFRSARITLLAVPLLAAALGSRSCPLATAAPGTPAVQEQPAYKSPSDIALSSGGQFAYVTNHTANSLSVIDTAKGTVIAEIPVGRAPSGVAVHPGGWLVFVANTGDHTVSFINTKSGKVAATVRCGFEPTGLAVSPDGRQLYTANLISNDVSVIDVRARKEVRRIKVGRAPTHLALTPDGRLLVVNHLLSHEPATNPKLTAPVVVIDTQKGQVIGQKRSPGTMLLGQGIAVSPDGKFAFCVHSRPNFNVAPSQLNQGWVHSNALSIIPLGDPTAKVVTVLLDNVSSGAANPHGIAVSRDGKTLFVSHRGTHQLSIVSLPKLRQLIGRTRPDALAMAHVNLGFLWQTGEIVRRVSSGGLGPRGVAVSPADGSVWVANYFSNSVAVLDPATGKVRKRIELGGPKQMTLERRGEFLFYDAAHSFQQWLSCSSCHPGVRVDGVNWDLLNDGMTNPKNAKSLVGSWQTPPVMATGVRPSMEVAAEKGFLFIQFVQPTPEQLEAVRAFLRWVPYIPSPWFRRPDGSLVPTAQRGKQVFEKAGCSYCHPAPLYTDLKMYSVGTRTKRELPQHRKFDVPSLRELYRTAPYLHDGRAATLREVITKFNSGDQHGATSDLTPRELDDLVAFLNTL